MTTRPLRAHLVCGSLVPNHDFDFARRALLDALYAAENIRTDVWNNYDNGAALESGDFLVSYTSQVPVSDANCEALRRFLERGGRWFAIHASNSVLDNQHLPRIVGSKLITHAPYMRFAVAISAPDDPLMDGLPFEFEVEDELYVVEQHADFEVLLDSRWGGEGIGRRMVPEQRWPLMYRNRVGDGGVLYLSLGHANRTFEKQRPDMPDPPDRRGPWALPVYQALIKRGIEWAAKRRPF